MTPDTDDRAFETAAGPDPQAPVLDTAPAANTYARTWRRGPFTVVEATGEIDLESAQRLAEHLDAATAAREPDVLVDLRGVTFLDCSGLRVLCRAESRARQRSGRLRVVGDGPRVRRLLRAAGLLQRFPPLPDIPGERR
ncbi:STAS domain-containing protein [Streptomyces mangrovisoli]|uniref:Anti-sigma factor antagonist n=1 Tax=Streptomyces mangrovisoli TaxID=1428628 RepID=A0A1J4P5U7_9ACTN|nr:STAS domain-containing protein [Streptomyces mangrovisoli]OIJ68893.1 anti-anti-sigma factor [Streptomyces mangrovisoli]